MKSGVKRIIASSEDANKAAKVELSDGQIIETDVIIMGVGVGPATGFLKDSGFTLEKDGGVRVDEFLRVLGLQNVYAIGKLSNSHHAVFSDHLMRVAGDIAVYPQVQDPTPRRIEHWNVAGNHGRAVGRTIAGKGGPFAKIPVFWSARTLHLIVRHYNYAHLVLLVGGQLRYCGIGQGYDDIHVDGNPAELKVRPFLRLLVNAHSK
jgi:NADPH-dependent 2,4-dienoyl-CoA reductase/sulfur reductase-like enzyme